MEWKGQMRRVRKKVAAIMHDPAPQPMLSLASLLYAGSRAYAAALALRQRMFDTGRLTVAALPRPVISIGNITVGGTGKTPMTLSLARLLVSLGYRTTIISRGYKGAGEKRGWVVSDGRRIVGDARMAGDEPLLLARLLGPGVPVVVGSNRYAAGLTAIDRFDPDVLLLDDGYQHRQLARDLNILLLDATSPFGNTHLLPRGSLREPVSAVSRADMVVFTRCQGMPPPALDLMETMPSTPPIYRTDHISIYRGRIRAGQRMEAFDWSAAAEDRPSPLAGAGVVVFSGLAHNRQFRQSVTAQEAKVLESLEFDDHHAYGPSDVERISMAAQAADCDALVTTDKDLVRLPADTVLQKDLIVLGVEIEFAADDDRWRAAIAHRVGEICQGKNK